MEVKSNFGAVRLHDKSAGYWWGWGCVIRLPLEVFIISTIDQITVIGTGFDTNAAKNA